MITPNTTATAVDLPRLVRRFKRQVKSLGETLDLVRDIKPEATLYASDQSVNLIDGESHEGERSRQHATIASERLDISGGGW